LSLNQSRIELSKGKVTRTGAKQFSEPINEKAMSDSRKEKTFRFIHAQMEQQERRKSIRQDENGIVIAPIKGRSPRGALFRQFSSFDS
jgi:hypothetical protein